MVHTRKSKNEDMLRFLNENTPVTLITKIVEMTVKDCDDEIGAIGEHLVVTIEVKEHDRVLGSKAIPRTCYVNRKVV